MHYLCKKFTKSQTANIVNMKSDYKKLGKFIAILLTLLIILIAFNSNENTFTPKTQISETDTENFSDNVYNNTENADKGFGKTYNAMHDDNLIEIDKHVH